MSICCSAQTTTQNAEKTGRKLGNQVGLLDWPSVHTSFYFSCRWSGKATWRSTTWESWRGAAGITGSSSLPKTSPGTRMKRSAQLCLVGWFVNQYLKSCCRILKYLHLSVWATGFVHMFKAWNPKRGRFSFSLAISVLSPKQLANILYYLSRAIFCWEHHRRYFKAAT